jgi:hypothetical protein
LIAHWRRRPQLWIGLGIFLLAVGVYHTTTSPSISFWDCGEFIATSHIVGVPHQPGTPLYVLMGRCFDILFGSPDVHTPAMKTAAAVNFMSNVFSALALMLIYLIILDLARRADPDSGWIAHVGGVVGALFLLFSQTFWNNAIEAEVYGLAACMITLLAWLTLRWYDTAQTGRSNRLLFLIIYLLGLGVGFHLGTLLVYPGIFVLILLTRQRHLHIVDLLVMSLGLALFLFSTITRNNSILVLFLLAYVLLVLILVFAGRRFALIGSAVFVLGLTVHFVMMVRAPLEPAINQTQPETFKTMMSVLRREQYPPINPLHRQAPLLWQFQYYYNFFLRQFTFLDTGPNLLNKFATLLGPIFLGMLGLLHGLRRARPLIWLFVVGYLINADALTFYLNFTDHEVRERDYFYFAAFMFFAVFIGLGASALLRYAAGAEGKSTRQLAPGESVTPVRTGRLPKFAGAVLIVIAALPILPGHIKHFEHDRSDNWIAREYAWNLLAGLDEGAIVFTNGDNDTFPVWYLQEVELFRPDVTVVNLSLVNLPWYVKQMRRRDPPIPLSFSNDQIDQIRARIYEDAETGDRFIIYVRDYVVEDIIRTNSRTGKPRPVFFAVTIPRENMARYYPFLQMEGLAYRLRTEKSEDGRPTVNSARLLHNMLGVYDYEAMLTEDSDARRDRYAELAGWHGDYVSAGMVGPQKDDIPYDELLPTFGARRYDVYRDENTQNLLGNYPAALVQAGFDYLRDSQEYANSTSGEYERYRDKSFVLFDLARRFDDSFGPILDIYPLLLADKGMIDEALEYLSSVSGKVPVADEERAFTETSQSLLRIGEGDRVLAWLDGRLAAQPERKFLYDLAFRINQSLGRIQDCQRILERWQAVGGASDPNMIQAIERMRQQAQDEERRRIEDAVQEQP